MKELSIEDKAKRYDGAIKVAQRFYNNSAAITKKGLEDIFPELKESEDEKIRKEILEFFSQFENGELRGVDISSWIAYLEKQGEKGINGKNREIPFAEQKPADKVEPKFKVGQTIKKKDFNLGFTIVKIEDGFYYNDKGDYFPFTDEDNWELVEQKPVERNIWKDTKKELPKADSLILAIDDLGVIRSEYYEGDGYLSKDENIKLSTHHTKWCYQSEAKEIKQPVEWSEEDDDNLSWLVEMLLGFDGNDIECYKDKKFIDKCKEVCKWLKAIKDRTFPQPKQEWSEEDEGILACIIGHLSTCLNEEAYKKYKSWLKPLKDRVQPQPKQEWGEEDKDKLNRIYSILGQAADTHAFSTTCRLIGDRECIELQDFLKFLRPQNAWKPSDEQIEILDMVLTNESMDDNVARILRELREQLKKLREG